MNVRVEYETTPIRHIAVQCPECGKWFAGRDIADMSWSGRLNYDYQISWATFTCPVCKTEFGGRQNAENINITEVYSADECYKDCLKKKEIWA